MHIYIYTYKRWYYNLLTHLSTLNRTFLGGKSHSKFLVASSRSPNGWCCNRHKSPGASLALPHVSTSTNIRKHTMNMVESVNLNASKESIPVQSTNLADYIFIFMCSYQSGFQDWTGLRNIFFPGTSNILVKTTVSFIFPLKSNEPNWRAEKTWISCPKPFYNKPAYQTLLSRSISVSNIPQAWKPSAALYFSSASFFLNIASCHR